MVNWLNSVTYKEEEGVQIFSEILSPFKLKFKNELRRTSIHIPLEICLFRISIF